MEGQGGGRGGLGRGGGGENGGGRVGGGSGGLTERAPLGRGGRLRVSRKRSERRPAEGGGRSVMGNGTGLGGRGSLLKARVTE
ncbi:hypothetical protein B1218_37835, partial [Pseudomonas ogarae]